MKKMVIQIIWMLLRQLLESQNVDVWIMPYYKSINHLRSAYTNSNLKYKELSKGLSPCYEEGVYQGRIVYSNYGYDDMYDESSS